MKILSQMIVHAGDGAVCFAGEHVSEPELIQGLFYTSSGTVNGAYKSGERAANKILDHYSGKQADYGNENILTDSMFSALDGEIEEYIASSRITTPFFQLMGYSVTISIT